MHRYIGLRDSGWAETSVFLMFIHDCTTLSSLPLGEIDRIVAISLSCGIDCIASEVEHGHAGLATIIKICMHAYKKSFRLILIINTDHH